MAPRKSAGRSAPLAMPRLLEMKPAFFIFFSGFMLGLCASVCSMMMEYARMKAVSVEGKTPGLFSQYRCANFSMMRSIFCASPGRRKPDR